MSIRQDPRIALIDFLRAIPISIRMDEYVFITLYCLQLNPDDDFRNLESNVHKYLSISGFRGVGAVICARAVITRRMSRALQKINKAELDLKGIEEFQPEFSQRILLGIPLKKKHYSQVVGRWDKLLKNALSDDNIDYYERNPRKLCEI